jgi:hypothetical protein
MKNSKHQGPSTRETSTSKFQTGVLPVLDVGSWNFSGAWMLDVGAFLACAACYGRSDSPLASGMNWGIFTLMGVILTVLTCITLFFVHVIRGEQSQIETDKNPPPQNPPKV